MNFLIQLVVGVVLSLASTLLKQAFSSQQKKATGTRGTAQIGGKVPQYFLVGTIGEAGKHEYRNYWGKSGDVPNAFNVDVYSFGDLPISALSKLFVFGVQEPVATTGHVLQGFPTTGDKAGKLWVEFRDGTQTTASAYLTGKFASDADRPWLADMIGRGIPHLVLTALWDEKVWTRFPEIVGEFQGIKLYDVRKDSTAGGIGPQRWADQSTWAFSDNNIVIIYNVLRGIFYEGRHIWGGQKTAADLPYAVWAAAMDACDAPVPLVEGGTEKRFRAGRRIDLNEAPLDVIKEFLIGANARISYASDGQVYVIVGVPAAADGAFSDLDVLATEPLGSIPFPNLDGIINGGTATYREPRQAWEDKETAPYYRSDLEEEDDGRQQVEGLDLGTTFSGTQAQRVLKAVIEEGRRFGTHVVALPPEFARFRPLQVLAWTSARFGYTAKWFLITARTRSPWGQVIFGLQEIDPADHEWTPAEDEKPLSFAPVVVSRPPPQMMTGWGAVPWSMVDPNGTGWLPTIKVNFDGGLVDVRAVRIQVREDWGSYRVVFDGEITYDPLELLPSAVINASFLRNKPYGVRGIYLPFSGRVTRWSNQDIDGVDGEWLGVTTPPVSPLPPGSVGNTELSRQVRDAVGFLVGGGMASLEDRILQELDKLAGSQTTQTMASDRDRKVLSSQLGQVAAAVVQESITRATEDSALSQHILDVAAQAASGLAEGLFTVRAESAPSGVLVRLAMLARITTLADYVDTGIIIDLVSDGGGGFVSRILMKADTMYWTDGETATIPMVFEDGRLKLNIADIGTVIAGLLRDQADSYRFDVENGRFYRTDSLFDIDAKNRRIRIRKAV